MAYCASIDGLPGMRQAVYPRLHDSQQAAVAKRQQSGTCPAGFGWSWMSYYLPRYSSEHHHLKRWKKGMSRDQEPVLEA
eukprot:1095994-Pelagomonas_calceolata.AAC.4